VWDPQRDDVLPEPYSVDRPRGKAASKAALQAQFGLEPDAGVPLLGVVSRLTSQKGLDLVLAVLPDIVRMGAQLVVQGTGDAPLEAAFRAAAAAYPQRVGVRLDYDEPGAHLIIAGADMIVVPSRFEPCGLTQLYGLRYGTVPIVRRVGGLADSVFDAGTAPAAQGNGFVFEQAQPQALREAILRALLCYRSAAEWSRLMHIGMSEDLSWDRPARRYMALYEQACAERRDTGHHDTD
jgi:starch synthase